MEGALVAESGNFSTTDLVKRIPLTQAPIVEGSVQVFVNGDSATSGVYEEVTNVFLASGASDKVFQLVSTDNFAATIVFGDNTLGVSPRIGDNYFVTYRVGGGSRGNIANDIINTTITITDPESATVNGTLKNVSQGTGGSDAETIEHAKKYAPLTFSSQGS